MDLSQLIIRIALGFMVLFALARIMGRKEISQMTFFNFVSAIAIGSIAANLVVSRDLSVRNGVIALVGWAVITLAMDFIDIKFKAARTLTTGQPVIVIRDGKIMEDSLRKVRLDVDKLEALLREKDVFSTAEVDYAIFETSGKLSVMKKENKQSVTKGDIQLLNMKQKVTPIATEVVSDGKVNAKNLTKLHLNQDWLNQQLKQQGINSIDEVFYAEVQQDGTLYVDNKNDIQ